MSVIKTDHFEIPLDIVTGSSNCRAGRHGEKGTTREGPKACAFIASGPAFIAEITETNTFMLTGQVVSL